MSGRAYEVEYRILDAGGRQRWVLESGQPQRVPGEDGFWVDGIISDISERKDNEMRIQALLAEQGAILDNVMFGVVITRDRRIVSVNRRTEQLFGYPAGSLVGRPASVFFLSDEDHAGPKANSSGAWRAATTPATNGSSAAATAACVVHGQRQFDRPGRPELGNVWVFADISERKQNEEKLRLSATVIEHIADGVMVVDMAGTIVTVNPAFTHITGYEARGGGRQTLERDALEPQ